MGKGHEGCRLHRGKPLIWRRGCPIESGTVKHAFKKSAKDGEGYQPNGDSPLTPLELLQIRTRLLSTNRIEDFQLWVLLLISIKLFLRSNEATGDKKDEENSAGSAISTGLTQEKSIDSSLSSVVNGILEALAMKVKGTQIYG